MSTNLIRGFILEGSKPSHYYHRSGAWVQYSSPAAGYVWSSANIGAILEAYEKNPKEWPIVPTTVHPAVHDPSTGVTVLVGQAQPANKVAAPAEHRSHERTNYTGKTFNLQVVAQGISQDIVAISVSL